MIGYISEQLIGINCELPKNKNTEIITKQTNFTFICHCALIQNDLI